VHKEISQEVNPKESYMMRSRPAVSTLLKLAAAATTTVTLTMGQASASTATVAQRSAASHGARPDGDILFRFFDEETGLCLDSDKAGKAYTDDIGKCDSYNNKNQLWAHATSGENFYVIRDSATGWCLVSASGHAVNAVTTAPCNRSRALQQWSFQPIPNAGTDLVVNAGTGTVLDSDHAGHVYTDAYNGGFYQDWVIVVK
jgi:hypothetical protein